MSSIADNIKKIKEQTKAKLISLGRPEDDLTIVAVTKTHPVEVIEEALRNGISISEKTRCRKRCAKSHL